LRRNHGGLDSCCRILSSYVAFEGCKSTRCHQRYQESGDSYLNSNQESKHATAPGKPSLPALPQKLRAALPEPGQNLADEIESTVFFRVDFKADTRTVVNSATITVGITSWPLQSSRVALLQSGVSIAQIGFEGTQGDAANEILAAMQKTPGEVVVSATRAFTPGDEFPTEHNL
jgi:hypothetical protein